MQAEAAYCYQGTNGTLRYCREAGLGGDEVKSLLMQLVHPNPSAEPPRCFRDKFELDSVLTSEATANALSLSRSTQEAKLAVQKLKKELKAAECRYAESRLHELVVDLHLARWFAEDLLAMMSSEGSSECSSKKDLDLCDTIYNASAPAGDTQVNSARPRGPPLPITVSPVSQAERCGDIGE